MSNIVVEVFDDGGKGARLETDELGRKGCPGLGGWKNWHGRHVTWVKGPLAQELIDYAAQAPGRIIVLEMDGDKIVGKYI